MKTLTWKNYLQTIRITKSVSEAGCNGDWQFLNLFPETVYQKYIHVSDTVNINKLYKADLEKQETTFLWSVSYREGMEPVSSSLKTPSNKIWKKNIQLYQHKHWFMAFFTLTRSFKSLIYNKYHIDTFCTKQTFHLRMRSM